MKSYFILLVSVSVICSFVEVLSPDGENEGIINHVRLLSSLCVLAVICVPVMNFFASVKNGSVEEIDKIFDAEQNMSKYEEIYKQNIGKETVKEAEILCKEDISKRFDMKKNSFDVKLYVNTDDDVFKVDSSRVYLHREAINKNPHLIKEYMEKLFSCECRIIYK